MLVDTSVWIDYFDGHPSSEANRLEQAIADHSPIAIVGVVLTEILLGLTTESDAVRISGLLDAFDFLPEPLRSDYIEAARIYRVCRGKGYTIRSPIDCVIAQLCLRENLPLLCKDRDFQVIGKSFPLRIL
jgi:predicted nucleic acid-binding protein